MIKKATLILVIAFSIQVIISCVHCNCPDESRLNMQYDSVTIRPINTAGFNPTEVIDSTNRNAFGIEVIVFSEINSPSNATVQNLSLGFKTAMACDCKDNSYTDQIINVELYVIDTETSVRTNVTSNFGIASIYEDEIIPLSQFFKERENWQDDFQFDLVDNQSIPSSAIFIADVYLESGAMFSNESVQVNFR
jgi:hypothetical protein